MMKLNCLVSLLLVMGCISYRKGLIFQNISLLYHEDGAYYCDDLDSGI